MCHNIFKSGLYYIPEAKKQHKFWLLLKLHCLEGKILSLPFAKNNKFITLFFASLCIIETFVKPQQIKTTI
ncbi:hypothetical protein BSPLISOX_2591 [uncultured Gammaproteobacteria bacterium]|nr:hypothetical protein BSPLISOX_2591 [uncultured Gammaproteobacteria bacterium]